MLDDLLSSSRVRDFVNAAGADVGVGTNSVTCAIPAGNFGERANLVFRLLPLALQFCWRAHKGLFDFAQLGRTSVQKGTGRLDDLLPGGSGVVARHANVFLMQNHCHQIKRNALDLVQMSRKDVTE